MKKRTIYRGLSELNTLSTLASGNPRRIRRRAKNIPVRPVSRQSRLLEAMAMNQSESTRRGDDGREPNSRWTNWCAHVQATDRWRRRTRPTR